MTTDRRLVVIVLVLGLLIGGSGGFWYGKSFRIQESENNVAPGDLAMQVNSVSGIVVETKSNSFVLQVAPSGASATLSEGSGTREVIIVASTKIVRNEYQPKVGGMKEVVMKLSDLKSGDSVSVDTKGDITSKSFEALRVFVRTAPPA